MIASQARTYLVDLLRDLDQVLLRLVAFFAQPLHRSFLLARHTTDHLRLELCLHHLDLLL